MMSGMVNVSETEGELKCWPQFNKALKHELNCKCVLKSLLVQQDIC